MFRPIWTVPPASNKATKLNINVGLYRDDALCVTKLRPQQYEQARQRIVKLFNDNGLKITISAGIKQCDFLDVSLDLGTMLYKPYHKENKIPKYVNVGSNHPRSIIKNIPLGVQERLSMTSSNEEIFNDNIEMYQKALNDAGHKHRLTYQDKDINSYNKPKKRSRQKREFYFNAPMSLM